MTRKWVEAVAAALLLLSLACGPCGCDGVRGAPAPLAKRQGRAKPCCVLGDWTQTWAGVSFDAWFRDDGTCGAVGQGDVWRGSWSLRGGTLYVTEEAGDGRRLVWDCELDENMAGTARVRQATSAEWVGRGFGVRFVRR